MARGPGPFTGSFTGVVPEEALPVCSFCGAARPSEADELFLANWEFERQVVEDGIGEDGYMRKTPGKSRWTHKVCPTKNAHAGTSGMKKT